MQSTSKYITGTLSLHFRKILTKLIHSRYFEVDIADLYVKAYYIWLSVLSLLSIYAFLLSYEVSVYLLVN